MGWELDILAIYSQTTPLWLEMRTTFLSTKILSFTEKIRVFKLVRNFFMDGVSVGKGIF